jgi:transposase
MLEQKLYQVTVSRSQRYNCEEAYLGKGIKLFLVLKVSKSSVVSIIGKLKKYGTTQTLPRAGRPTKLSSWARRTLVRDVTKNAMTPLTELQSSLAEIGEPARGITVSTALHQYGRVAKGKPLLRKKHMIAHLDFAKRHMKNSESIRQKIMWSDETKM